MALQSRSFLPIVLVLSITFASRAATEEHPARPICNERSGPVCGDNGRLYSHACNALSAGCRMWVRLPASGRCPSCRLTSGLVCGDDLKMYSNECQAVAAGCKAWAPASRCSDYHIEDAPKPKPLPFLPLTQSTPPGRLSEYPIPLHTVATILPPSPAPTPLSNAQKSTSNARKPTSPHHHHHHHHRRRRRPSSSVHPNSHSTPQASQNPSQVTPPHRSTPKPRPRTLHLPPLRTPIPTCRTLLGQVCGDNGRLYADLCQAVRAGRRRWRRAPPSGVCPPCNLSSGPVCGEDRRLHPNECWAMASGCNRWSAPNRCRGTPSRNTLQGGHMANLFGHLPTSFCSTLGCFSSSDIATVVVMVGLTVWGALGVLYLLDAAGRFVHRYSQEDGRGD